MADVVKPYMKAQKKMHRCFKYQIGQIERSCRMSWRGKLVQRRWVPAAWRCLLTSLYLGG